MKTGNYRTIDMGGRFALFSITKAANKKLPNSERRGLNSLNEFPSTIHMLNPNVLVDNL